MEERRAELRLKGVKNMTQKILKRDREDETKREGGGAGREGRRGRGTQDDELEAGTSAFSPNTA